MCCTFCTHHAYVQENHTYLGVGKVQVCVCSDEGKEGRQRKERAKNKNTGRAPHETITCC